MILRPRLADFKVVGFYTGKVITGVGLLMVIPFVTALMAREWNPAIDFAVGIGASLVLGLAAQIASQTTKAITWSHGLVVTCLSWIMAVLLSAIPAWLSGHFGSYLDACFDLMSGYTTTGLILIQDLDHVSHTLNMWRHLVMYTAGQGIIVMAITFLFGGAGGAYAVYVGEGKDERLLPNIIQTARAIWLISIVYLIIGTLSLWIIGVWLGQSPIRSFLHGLWIFMAGWSTGGFAPQSYNTFYYHSLAYEVATITFCILGTVNFALHWAVWTGNRREIRKNIETISFLLTMAATMIVTTAGLIKLGVYSDSLAVFRKMFYQVASGHTGTGYATVYARTFVRQWGPLAMIGVIIAMAIGGSACSTAGGIKGMRMGLFYKTIRHTIRRILSPESSVVVEKWHHLTDRILDDTTARSAMTMLLCYLAMYALGSLAGVWHGYEPVQSAFEAVSAGANVGLSCGITSPGMPGVMKIIYMLQMLSGRLEFISLFALGGFLIGLVRGR